MNASHTPFDVDRAAKAIPLQIDGLSSQDQPSASDAIAAPKQKIRRRWLMALAAVLAAGGGFYLYQNQITPRPTEDVPAPAVERVMRLSAFDVTSVERQTLQEVVRVSGSLVPGRQGPVTALVAGKVLSVEAEPGGHVAEGQVVARLDPQNLLLQIDQQRNAIAATEAQLALAQRQLESAKTLAERDVGTRANLASAQSNFDAISANLAAQHSQLQGIELMLSDTTVKAPFSGIVATRNVEAEQMINAGAAIATLVDISTMELQAVAPVAAADVLQPSQRVEVDIEGLGQRRYDGEILRISPVAIEGTRSIQVYVRIDNSAEILRGGMFATGRVIVAETGEAIAAPSAAIRTDMGGSYVLVVSGDRLERRDVEIVQTWNNGRLTEIASGLEVGDRFISTRLDELEAGMAITMSGR